MLSIDVVGDALKDSLRSRSECFSAMRAILETIFAGFIFAYPTGDRSTSDPLLDVVGNEQFLKRYLLVLFLPTLQAIAEIDEISI